MKKFSAKRIMAIGLFIIIVISCILRALSYFTLSPIKESGTVRKVQALKGTQNAELCLTDDYGNGLFADRSTGEFYYKSSFGEKGITPFSNASSVSGMASAVEVTLVNKKGETKTYNSTTNSSSFGAFSVENEKGAIKFIYSFYESEEKYNSDKEGNLIISVPLVFSVEKGRMKAEVDLSAVSLNKGYGILNISLLPGIFCVNDLLDDSYYILPENSGFILALGMQGNEDKEVCYDAYSVKSGESRKVMSVPYGCFSNGETLTTIVPNDGDALFSLRYIEKNGSFSLVPEFKISTIGKNLFGVKQGNEYNGKISISLMFCKEETGAYNTAASQVRAFYIDKNYLKDTVSISGELPFILTTVGSVNGKQDEILTSFEDLEEMVTLLNSKGVRSLFIRYAGAFKKGLYATETSVGELNTELGSEKEFNKLLETVNDKNSKLFLEASLISAGEQNESADGEKKTADFYSDIKSIIKFNEKQLGIADVNTFENNVSETFSFASEYEDLGISLCDAVKSVPVDKKTDKQTLLDNEIDKLSSLNVNSSVCVALPNICYLKNADIVTNIFTTQTSFGTGFDMIPFTNIVLHGSVIYGGDYVNLSDGWNTVLKCIEYGAVPSFIFTYNKCENLSYGEYASTVAKYYSKIKSLKAVTSLPMTSHEEIYKDVYKVIYGYNKIVYINYTGSVQTVEGVMLSPNDFLLV